MSYLNSLAASSLKDKENMNPNYPTKAATGFSPALKSRLEHGMSAGSRPSFLNTITHQHDSTQQSLKTIIRHFCPSTNENSFSQSPTFLDMIRMFMGKNELTLREAIETCEQNQIYYKSDIVAILNNDLKKSQKKKQNQVFSLKKLLVTELGALKVEELLEAMKNEQNINIEQEKILNQLFMGEAKEQLSQEAIIEAYQQLKQEASIEQGEIKKMGAKFGEIYRCKIENRLWSDHIRLQISKGLNHRTHKSRITFEGLSKTMANLLNNQEVACLFRYAYGLETNSLMAILDKSKTVNATIITSQIFRHGNREAEPAQFQEKNIQFCLEEQHRQIEKFERQRQEFLQTLNYKDKQIQRLNKMMELMEIQKGETERFSERNLALQLESQKHKYESKISELKSALKQQKTLTQWYQTELEAVMKAVNQGNGMLHSLTSC